MYQDEARQQNRVAAVPTQEAHAGHGQSGHEEHEEHIHLPPPSIWPITMAVGAGLGVTGLVFTTVVSIAGLLMMAWALVGWIQELRHEFD